MRADSTEYPDDVKRWVHWFHELDAWTEYWDIYHPETRGRYYFGNDLDEPGLLRQFLPRDKRPPAFIAWTRMALLSGDAAAFKKEISVPEVADAIMEIDELLARLFEKYFGDPAVLSVQKDYLAAMFRFATDSLPPATERDAKISVSDPRKRTAGRHTLEGDIMWFAWSLEIEAAYEIAGSNKDHIRRALLLAGVAFGCSVNFTWRGHRRTRPEYNPDAVTEKLLYGLGIQWVSDFENTRKEIHALYRIREWGGE